MLRFDTNSASPFVHYALDLVERIAGLSFVPVEPGASPVAGVYYGNDLQRPCALRIPFAPGYTAQTVPGLPGPDDAPGHDPQMPFPFDLFAAIRFWVADEGNAIAPPDAFDSHERILANRSAQESRNLREVPIVNAYVWLLADWIEARTVARRQTRLLSGQKCMVVLSHDIDDPINPGDWRHGLQLVGNAARRGRVRRALAYANDLRRRLRSRWHRPNDRHWLFREVLDAESRYGFRSTFFFASTPRFEAGAAPFDVDYDVQDRRFGPVLREITQRKSEIGLHISYNARESANLIASERQLLERASGVPVHGSRHHYWHMRRPFWSTLADHAQAGLRYDTSVGFNEAPGLRLGVAFPFYPWNPMTQQAIPVLQIPTFLMDGAFFYDSKIDVQSALSWFARLLENLKRHQGVAAIDWHCRTSFPGSLQYQRWGEAYLAILAILAADPEVRVGSCEEAYHLFQSPRPALERPGVDQLKVQ